jgi:hypothetical protein
MNHEPMHKIIKLKRYEQPPEGYYQDFLHEFHRRQRAELLNLPLSTLIMERLLGLIPEFRVPAMAFAGAAAVAIIASLAIIRETPQNEMARAYSTSYTPTRPYSQTPVTIQNIQPVSLRINTDQQIQPQNASTLFPPSYLLQARPVSHESPLSF